MSHSVRAVVSARPDQVAVEEISLAPLGADQVMIRTLHSGVSTGTDKWVLQGKFTWGNAQYPLCPGYQRVGVIEELGADVTAFRVGQVVATTTSGIARSAPKKPHSHDQKITDKKTTNGFIVKRAPTIVGVT